MKITKKFLEEKKTCKEGIKYFDDNFKNNIDIIDLINQLMVDGKFNWIIWLATRVFTHEQNIRLSIFCAELVLPIFEAYDKNDRRPRDAIEAAKKYLTAAAAADAAKTAAAAKAADDAAVAAYSAAAAAADAAKTAATAKAADDDAAAAYSAAAAAKGAYAAAYVAYAAHANAGYACDAAAYSADAAADANDFAVEAAHADANGKNIKSEIVKHIVHIINEGD